MSQKSTKTTNTNTTNAIKVRNPYGRAHVNDWIPQPVDGKASVGKWRRSTCRLCIASQSETGGCLLGYPAFQNQVMKDEGMWAFPLERCPKPKTRVALIDCLAQGLTWEGRNVPPEPMSDMDGLRRKQQRKIRDVLEGLDAEE